LSFLSFRHFAPFSFFRHDAECCLMLMLMLAAADADITLHTLLIYAALRIDPLFRAIIFAIMLMPSI